MGSGTIEGDTACDRGAKSDGSIALGQQLFVRNRSIPNKRERVSTDRRTGSDKLVSQALESLKSTFDWRLAHWKIVLNFAISTHQEILHKNSNKRNSGQRSMSTGRAFRVATRTACCGSSVPKVEGFERLKKRERKHCSPLRARLQLKIEKLKNSTALQF